MIATVRIFVTALNLNDKRNTFQNSVYSAIPKVWSEPFVCQSVTTMQYNVSLVNVKITSHLTQDSIRHDDLIFFMTIFPFG